MSEASLMKRLTVEEAKKRGFEYLKKSHVYSIVFFYQSNVLTLREIQAIYYVFSNNSDGDSRRRFINQCSGS